MSNPAKVTPDISHIRSPALNSKTRRSIYDMSCQRGGSGMVPLQRQVSYPRPNARQLSKLDALRLGPARPEGRTDQQ
jgi:hypothetical protein